MRQRITRQRTDEVWSITCDVCGSDCSPQEGGSGPKQCVKCKRDLCRHKCTVWDPREHGDYPDAFCASCWSIGEPFRERQARLEKEHERQMEAIEEAWAAAVSEMGTQDNAGDPEPSGTASG